MKMGQCVPKRRSIKYRRRGITQKKAYKILVLQTRIHVHCAYSAFHSPSPHADALCLHASGNHLVSTTTRESNGEAFILQKLQTSVVGLHPVTCGRTAVGVPN
jgi:hypothetical protein